MILPELLRAVSIRSEGGSAALSAEHNLRTKHLDSPTSHTSLLDTCDLSGEFKMTVGEQSAWE